MKIICNVCYAEELTIHDYDGRLYADPCSCARHELESSIQQAYEDGWCEAEEDFNSELED